MKRAELVTTNTSEPIALSRVATIWAVMFVCLALSLGSSLAMLPAIDRWNDCGRLSPELDLSAVGSLALGAAAIATWFWLRSLIPVGRPEVLGLATAAMVTVLILVAAPLQLLGAGSWGESAQDFREACGISEWVALLRGMPLYLPAISLVALAIATPRWRALSARRLVTSLTIIIALWVAFLVIAHPFATFVSA